MAPALFPARRLSLFGCLLLAATALLLPGCGGDGDATADGTAAVASRADQRSNPTAIRGAGACPRRVGAFSDSLGELRRRLVVGLSYEQYAARVKALRGSYRRLPIGHLTLGCVTATGAPAEDALNEYIDAANAWGECLADAACSTATIEPVLQRRWRLASRSLSAAG